MRFIIFMARFIVALLCFVAIFSLGFALETYALDKPCGLTEEELASELKYELKQYAGDFLKAEEEYGVNAAFLSAVASLESGHGRYMFKSNNIFGWGGKSFDSVPECIDFVAEKMKKNYIDPNGKYYRGGDIADIGKIYCPNDTEWVRLVTEIYERISKKGEPNPEIATTSGKIIVYLR